MSFANKNFNNSSGISTDLNVNGNLNIANNITTSNLIATGNINFPVGSINVNCINGSITTPDDDSMYALINSGSGTQIFQGNQGFQNSLNLQGPVTFSSGSSINFSNTTVSNLSIPKANVSLGNVDNTSDSNKPVSTAQQTALNLKSNLSSPTFTGTLTSPSISTNALSLNGIDLYTTLSTLAPLLNPSFSGNLNLTSLSILTNSNTYWINNNANIPSVNFSLNQTGNGATTLNSSAGQIISLNIGNVQYANVSSSGFYTTVLTTPSIILNGTSLSSLLALLAPLSSPSFTGTLSVPNITLNSVNLSTTLSNKQAILNSTSSNAISCLSLITPTISLNGSDLTSLINNKQSIINTSTNLSLGALSCTSLTCTSETDSGVLNCNSLNVQKAGITSDGSSMWLYNNNNSYGVNFALYQSSSGGTVLNSSSGQTLDFKINNSTYMSISSNGVTLNNINLISTDILLNNTLLSTSLGLLAPKLNATLTTPTINYATINNANLNSTIVNGGITINQMSQNGTTFGSGMTFNYGNPSISYNIFRGVVIYKFWFAIIE